MSENQSQAINSMPAVVSTPTKAATRETMLIEIPVNTSPTSASKAKERLSKYPPPREDSTIETLNEKLQKAEQRREQSNTALQSGNQERMEKVQKKQKEIENQKKQAAVASAKKLAKASENRENITSEKQKKAAEHVSRAMEVCNSLKKAEQEEYKNKLEAIEKSQKAAAEKRGNILGQTKQKAAEHVENVHDKIAQKGKEVREKKAALDQKLKDAEARRNVVEVSKTLHKKKGPAVCIEIDTTEIKTVGNTAAKARLEAQANGDTNTLTLENVEDKLKNAEARREQLLLQRTSSPKAKKNAAQFQQNREQLETGRKQAEEAKAKRTAEAEAKVKSIHEERAKKAGEHCTKVKAVLTSQKENEVSSKKTKAEEIATKQQAAEARHEAQLQQRKESAGTFNLKVGENAKIENEKLKGKKQSIHQKMADAEARRRVVETYKSSPAKFRVSSSSSPTKHAAVPPAAPAF